MTAAMRRAGRSAVEPGEQQPQELPEPVQEEREVVSGGGQHGVDGVAVFAGEIVAVHAVLGLEMADDRLDGRAPPHVALDRWCDARFWPLVRTRSRWLSGAL